jgi:hypothetical protein
MLIGKAVEFVPGRAQEARPHTVCTSPTAYISAWVENPIRLQQ